MSASPSRTCRDFATSTVCDAYLSQRQRSSGQKVSEAGLAAMKARLRWMEAGKRSGNAAEAARADLEFRRTLYAAADNPILLGFIDQAWLSLPFSILYSIPGRLAPSIKEQHQVLDAVGRRDRPRRASACRSTCWARSKCSKTTSVGSATARPARVPTPEADRQSNPFIKRTAQ